MFKKSLIALSLLTLPLTASANWSAGAGYANLSDDDLSLGMVYGAVAYEFAAEGSKFSFMPEFRLGTGISDDEVNLADDEYSIPELMNVKVEVDRFIALSVRGQYNHDSGFYAYVMPSYANLDVKVSYLNDSISEDEWELGFGAGFGKKFNDKVSVEASYETYDGTDVFTVGVKYAF